jgi:hypothetical protein
VKPRTITDSVRDRLSTRYFPFPLAFLDLQVPVVKAKSESSRANHDDRGKPAVLAGEVVLDRGRVGQKVAWVVDEADKCGVAGVSLVLGLVLDQLVHQFTLAEAFPCHLGLDDDALGFQEQV